MKRYDLVWSVDGDKIDRMDEKPDGDYVLYSDIKSDRALLEEAVKLLSNGCHTGFIDCRSCEGIGSCLVKHFLTRAKERLGK